MTTKYNSKQKKRLLSLLGQLREGLKGSENLRWDPTDFFADLHVLILKPPTSFGVGLKLIAAPISLDKGFHIIWLAENKNKCAGIYIVDYVKERKTHNCAGMSTLEFLQQTLPDVISGWEDQLTNDL